MLTGNMMTAEAAARYDPADESPARAVAGDLASPPGERLGFRAANGRWLEPQDGQWVIRYAPGDLGLMDAGEYARWFGKPS